MWRRMWEEEEREVGTEPIFGGDVFEKRSNGVMGVGLRKTFRFSLFKIGDNTLCLCGDKDEPGESKKR